MNFAKENIFILYKAASEIFLLYVNQSIVLPALFDKYLQERSVYKKTAQLGRLDPVCESELT